MTLTSEWKEVVRKLILMSYKLSAVVSPVVQSSSPEGLIPMDTDLGNAGIPKIPDFFDVLTSIHFMYFVHQTKCLFAESNSFLF